RKCRPSELFAKRWSVITTTPRGSEMWRPFSKRSFCRCCCGASTLAKSPRCRLANTNLHTIRTRNAITDRIAGAIEFRRRGNGLPLASDSALCQRSLTLPAGIVSPAASARSAACDGMNHQDFVLLARNFLKAFTSRHVKRLCASLGFILGNQFVYFFHVGGCRIIFEKSCIAAR